MKFTKHDTLTREQAKGFQNITSIASHVCETPIAMINFHDNEHQYTLFNVGWRKTQIPKKDSISQFALQHDDLLSIPDVSKDDKVQKVKMLQDHPEIEFYAGIKFKDEVNNRMGVLCILDTRPRNLTKFQKQVLKTLADDIRVRVKLIQRNQQLTRETKLLEGIIQNLPGIFCLIDFSGVIWRWNRNLETMTGYSGEDLDFANIEKFLVYDDIQIARGKLEEVFKDDQAKSEFTIVSKTGKQIPILVSGFRHRIDGENFAVVIGIDITEEKRILNQLLEKEGKLNTALERLHKAQHIARLGSWEWDNQHKTLYWSDEIYELLNLNKFEVDPSNNLITKFVHPDDKEKFLTIIRNALAGKGFSDFEHALLLSDNTVKYVYERGQVYYDEYGKTVKVIGTMQDITEQKQVELRLKETLREREVLLTEIHHRVKNNLAVISGLLQIEEIMGTEQGQTLSKFSNSLTRIKSIALIHEKLYSSEDFQNIALDSYVDDLLKSIENKYREGKDIRIKKEIDDTKLNINLAIPTGLLLNELISNAFKHAFPHTRSGIIEINIQSQGDEITMIVSDNGIGLPEGFDIKNQTSVGFTLIHVLSSQLKADCSVEAKPGARFTFIFKNRESKKGSAGNVFHQ